MAQKFNRILIIFIGLCVLFLVNLAISYAQTASTIEYFPLISNDPTRWIGPYGGTIVTIATDPINPQVSYAGTFGAGVFKSLNGGRNWISASFGLANLNIYSLAIDPTHPDTLYAGTYHNQIYKSENGGDSWVWSGAGMQDQAIVYSIAIDPFTPSTIFAATRGISNNGGAPWNGVVYRSLDGGQTWKAIIKDVGGPDLQDWIYSITVNPNHHNQVYIATHQTGPFRSDNSGDTWYSIHNGIQDDSGRSIVVSPLPDFAETLFYGVWHNDTLYKSINDGGSWKLANEGIPAEKVYAVALDPQDVDTLYLATFSHGLIKSVDGGNSWNNGGLPGDQLYSAVINPSAPGHLLIGTSGDGLYRTDDAGITWLRSNTGIQNSLITSVVISPTNSSALYTSVFGTGVYQSTNQGYDWEEMNDGLSDRYVLNLVMDPANPHLLYALTNTGGLFKYDFHRGDGWTSVGAGLPLTQNPIPAYPADHPFATLDMQEAFITAETASTPDNSARATLRAMVYAPSNAKIVYLATAGSGVYRSSDGAQSWHPAGLAYQNVLSIAVDLLDPNLVYAATTTPGSIKMTTDGGQNWSDISLDASFYSVAASPVEAGVFYAGTGAGIYRYQSGAWSLLGLADQLVTTITIEPANPNLIYAGTFLGAYYSDDGGLSWTFVNENLHHQVIQSISIDATNPNLAYYGTKTHGIFLTIVRSANGK